MEGHRLKVGAAGTVVLVALFIFSVTLFRAVVYAPEPEIDAALVREAMPEPTTATTTYYGNPLVLSIPALDIDAKIQQVGQKPDGSMANPNNFTDVGWYKYGVVPGETGSAVIAGHYDNGLGLAGVFRHLDELSIGDELSIIDEHGERIIFVVESTNVVPYDAPTEALFAASGPPRLRLITCTGEWISERKMYADRLIVTAVPKPKSE